MAVGNASTGGSVGWASIRVSCRVEVTGRTLTSSGSFGRKVNKNLVSLWGQKPHRGICGADASSVAAAIVPSGTVTRLSDGLPRSTSLLRPDVRMRPDTGRGQHRVGNRPTSVQRKRRSDGLCLCVRNGLRGAGISDGCGRCDGCRGQGDSQPRRPGDRGAAARRRPYGRDAPRRVCLEAIRHEESCNHQADRPRSGNARAEK
jgi:hypothetical protein